MKKCVDCAYHRESAIGTHRCHSTKLAKKGISPVTGEWYVDKVEPVHCEILRNGSWLLSVLGKSCGKRGRWFRQAHGGMML